MPNSVKDPAPILCEITPHVPSAIDEAWSEWSASVCTPLAAQLPGFTSCRRFKSVSGEFQYLTVYELTDAEISTDALPELQSDYLDAAPRRYRESFEATLRGVKRGIYHCLYSSRGPSTTPGSALLGVGHDVPSHRHEEFNAWYDTEHVPAMLDRVPGFLTGSRFHRTRPLHPGGERDDEFIPEYLTLYDLTSEDVLHSPPFQDERWSPWSDWVRSWYHRRFRVAARRL